MFDVTAIINLHTEGVLCGPSIGSLLEAVSEARDAGLDVEVLAVLDRSDALTTQMAQKVSAAGGRIILSSGGDPALARNIAAQAAQGKWIAYLDGDDLWSANWLTEAAQLAQSSSNQEILHCEAIVFFGADRAVWLHPDSDETDLDMNWLYLSNYWDAMSFGPRQAYLDIPFRASDLSRGFGMEDWDWNRVTLASGWRHRPVPGTLHMKRSRLGTQRGDAQRADVVPFPLPSGLDFKRTGQ